MFHCWSRGCLRNHCCDSRLRCPCFSNTTPRHKPGKCTLLADVRLLSAHNMQRWSSERAYPDVDLQIPTSFTKRVEPTPSPLFHSTSPPEELQSCMTGFPSLAQPDRPQRCFVLSQFSGLGLTSPAELFQCRKYILFLSLSETLGKYTSAASATIFPLTLAQCHRFYSVIEVAFNFSTSTESVSVSFKCVPRRLCCILWQSLNYSFLYQAQHSGEVTSLPSSERRVIMRRKWKRGVWI